MLPLPIVGRAEDKHILFIIGGGFYDRVVLKSYGEKHTQDGTEYQLRRHMRFVYDSLDRLFRKQRTYLWIFNKGDPEPMGIKTMADEQDYKDVTPATLKIIVTNNITTAYFKSLKLGKAFGGLGNRKAIMIFVGVLVLIFVLKSVGVF